MRRRDRSVRVGMRELRAQPASPPTRPQHADLHSRGASDSSLRAETEHLLQIPVVSTHAHAPKGTPIEVSTSRGEVFVEMRVLHRAPGLTHPSLSPSAPQPVDQPGARPASSLSWSVLSHTNTRMCTQSISGVGEVTRPSSLARGVRCMTHTPESVAWDVARGLVDC